MSIAITRHPAADAAFGVLAALPLVRDAASIYDDTIPDELAPWRARLTEAYQADAGRLALQFIGLRPVGVDALVADLRRGVLDGGPPQPAAALLDTFAEALEDWWQRHRDAWARDEAAHLARAKAARDTWLPTLTSLRTALWEGRGDVPALTIVDVPALGPAGRGCWLGTQRRVAASLAEPAPHPLLQTFHEEVHAAVDPLLPQARRPRDTRADADGHAVHRQIEHAALEVGAAIIEARHPALADAYAHWRSRAAGG